MFTGNLIITYVRTCRKQLDNDSRKRINELKQCLIDQENVVCTVHLTECVSVRT